MSGCVCDIGWAVRRHHSMKKLQRVSLLDAPCFECADGRQAQHRCGGGGTHGQPRVARVVRGRAVADRDRRC
eukprot:COSAG01_NODE_9576_length_2404_cov_1.721475_3_plen_71_part_01